MTKKRIKILSLTAAAVLALCSCQSRAEKDFLANKAAAESKSGLIYRTTYFVTHADEDKRSGLPYPKAEGEKYCYAFINDDGAEVELTPATLVDARAGYEVEDGKFIAPATLDGKQWGYVLVDINNPDTSNMIWDSDIKYDNAEAYSEGFAAVSENGKYGIIDVNGSYVVEPQYDSMKYCCFGVIPALKDGEWYFINLGNEKLYGPFEDAESFEYGYAAVKKNGKGGFIDKGGIDATTFVYDEAYSVEDDEETGSLTAWVRTGDKWEQVDIVKN